MPFLKTHVPAQSDCILIVHLCTQFDSGGIGSDSSVFHMLDRAGKSQ